LPLPGISPSIPFFQELHRKLVSQVAASSNASEIQVLTQRTCYALLVLSHPIVPHNILNGNCSGTVGIAQKEVISIRKLIRRISVEFFPFVGDELRKLISIPKSRIGLAIPLLQMVCAFLGKRILKSYEPV